MTSKRERLRLISRLVAELSRYYKRLHKQKFRAKEQSGIPYYDIERILRFLAIIQWVICEPALDKVHPIELRRRFVGLRIHYKHLAAVCLQSKSAWDQKRRFEWRAKKRSRETRKNAEFAIAALYCKPKPRPLGPAGKGRAYK